MTVTLRWLREWIKRHECEETPFRGWRVMSEIPDTKLYRTGKDELRFTDENGVTWRVVPKCPECKGTGEVDPQLVTCPTCGGSGKGPIRCQAWCSQWPNCQHDWSAWGDKR